jgi:putative ABC transport system permease protein
MDRVLTKNCWRRPWISVCGFLLEHSMNTIWQDLRYTLRTLSKSPGNSLVAVLTLALGIGTATAIFSFVDAVMLKPLGYPDAERLVTIWDSWPSCGTCLPSPPTFLEWKTRTTVFAQVAGYTDGTESLNLTGSEQAEQLQGRQVTANYFEMLGVQPALGRSFQVEEEQVGRDRVVIISHRLWLRRFNSDPDLIGKSITLNEKSYTVVGVLPPHAIFDHMDNELWTPLTIPPDRMRRSTQYFMARAKLKAGVTLTQGNAEMKRLGESVALADKTMQGHAGRVEPLRESIVTNDLRGTLLLLLGAVGFILLIACVNVTNLMLARGKAHRNEVLIRLAIGASGWRVMRELLTQSLMLSAAGGIAGLFLSYWLMKAFILLSPAGAIPREAVVGMDYRVLLFSASVSMLTGICFGLLPAFLATRADVNGLIQVQGSKGSSRNTSLNLSLVSEIAFTFVLMMGAALMIKSFSRLLKVDPGFDSGHVLTFRTTLAQTRFPTAGQTLAYQDQMLERLSAVPNVTAAGVTGGLPMSGVSRGTDFRILGRVQTRGIGTGNARFRAVDAGYFKALGIRLEKGRSVSVLDTPDSQRIVIVNQSLVRHFFPDSNPLGEQVRFAGPQPYTIVGVAEDVKYNGLDADAPLEIYVPLTQLEESWFNGWGRQVTFVVRTSGDPEASVASVRTLAMSLDKDQPVYDIKTMDHVVADSTATPRFRTFLFTAFGTLALMLAAVGIYGVISYATTQRTREIGIRVALGAQPLDIFKAIIGQGLTLTLIGLLIGLAGAWWLTRFLSTLLFHLTATDLATYALASAVMILVAIFSSYVPARRAMRVDPTVALKYE